MYHRPVHLEDLPIVRLPGEKIEPLHPGRKRTQFCFRPANGARTGALPEIEEGAFLSEGAKVNPFLSFVRRMKRIADLSLFHYVLETSGRGVLPLEEKVVNRASPFLFSSKGT